MFVVFGLLLFVIKENNGKVKRFEDLEVWTLACIICRKVEMLFQETGLGRNYSLRDQMENSSGSIMNNIAEGFGRGGNLEFINFLSYSKGSATELKSQPYRAFDKKLISQEQFDNLAADCSQADNRIQAFMAYLGNSEIRGIQFKTKKKVAHRQNHKQQTETLHF